MRCDDNDDDIVERYGGNRRRQPAALRPPSGYMDAPLVMEIISKRRSRAITTSCLLTLLPMERVSRGAKKK